jgi:hypothetical protein
MARIVWKENAIVSIKIRDNLFTLAQMINSPYLIFFNVFSADEQWKAINLEKVPVLFFRGVTRQFLQKSEITLKKEIQPITQYEAPKYWLQLGPGSQALIAWKGTPHEMSIMTLGEEGVRVIEKDITQSGFHAVKPVGPYLTGPEHKEIDKYELDTLGVYPETIERLYLCHFFKKNVDPDKDLICGKTLPKEYKIYYEAISQ